MSREYPSQPVVGIAAVILHDDRVLLVQRGREPAKGAWGLPGGVLELGESLEAGLRREVMEECGVAIEVGPLLATFEAMERDESGRLRFHYVVIDYLARYLGGDPRPDDDADAACWVALDELDNLPMRPETKDVIRLGVALPRQVGT